jgi:hypothetical protein
MFEEFRNGKRFLKLINKPKKRAFVLTSLADLVALDAA